MHDGDRGCEPVLPSETCAEGQMAVPGENMCRPVAPCGAAPWGDVPEEPSNEYVDASYTGGGSDGTKAHPWTSIQAAIDAASPNAIVAIAEGSYPEDPVVQGKAVRLWGRCPSLVDVAGAGTEPATIIVGQGGGGSEIRDLAVQESGITVVAAEDVIVDRVWIHDSADAFYVDDAFGAVSASLRRSLVERSSQRGVVVFGGRVAVEQSVVRDTQMSTLGEGVLVQAFIGRGDLRVVGSVVERSHRVGVFVFASDALVEGSVIRDTHAVASGQLGRGISVENDPFGETGALTVRGSLVERSADMGIFVGGSSGVIEATRIRDQQPGPGALPTAGAGIDAVRHPESLDRADLIVRDSLVERGCGLGIDVGASDALIERTTVRAIEPCADQLHGRGINVQDDPLNPQVPAKATIDACAIEDCHEFGVLALSAVVSVSATRIARTHALPNGSFGDGASSFTYIAGQEGSLTIAASWVSDSARAGISGFGSVVDLGSTRLECNLIQLDAEVTADTNYQFHDLGGNVCSCGDVTSACKVVSQNLAPPTPLQ